MKALWVRQYIVCVGCEMTKDTFAPFEQPPSYEDAIRTESTPSLQVATLQQFHNTVAEAPTILQSHAITVQPAPDTDPSGIMF